MADLGREKKNKSRRSNQLETWISLFFFAIDVSPSDQRLINEMATKMADQPLNQNGWFNAVNEPKKKSRWSKKTKQESDRSGGWEGVDTNRSAMTQRRYAVR